MRRALSLAPSGERVDWGLLCQLRKNRNQNKLPHFISLFAFSGAWCWMPGRRWQIRPSPTSLLTRVSFPSRALLPLHPLSFTALSRKMRRAPMMIPLLALVAFMAGCANAALTCDEYGRLMDRSKCWGPDIKMLVDGSLIGCAGMCENFVSEAYVQTCAWIAPRGACIYCNYHARGSPQTAGWTLPRVVHLAH